MENLQKWFDNYNNANVDNDYDDNDNLSHIIIADLGKTQIFAV